MTDSGLIMEERFFQWLSPQVPPSQLSILYDTYKEIDAYFQKKRVLQHTLFDTTDLSRLSAVKEIIEGDRMFRFFHKRNLNAMSAAIRFYIIYVKTAQQKRTSFVTQPAPPNDAAQGETVSKAEQGNEPDRGGTEKEPRSEQLPVKTDATPEVVPVLKEEESLEETNNLNPTDAESAILSDNLADIETDETPKPSPTGTQETFEQSEEPEFIIQTVTPTVPDSMAEGKAEESNPVTQMLDTSEETERYQTILREDFPDGFRQNYTIHAKKFIQRYAERYGAEPDMERDEIVQRLGQIGYVLDGRIYAKGDMSQTELLKEINAAIHDAFQNGASCVFLTMVYQRYQTKLVEQLNVYSADALRSLLTAYENWDYYERDGRLFSKYNPVDFSRRINDLPDVLRVMKDSYKPMNYHELQERLWYLPLDNIKSALVRVADVVSVDTETYFYAPHFPISQVELETLSRAMGREIKRRGFLTARNLRELLEQNCPSVSIDAAAFKDYGLRNALGVLLRDRFTFNGAIISEKGHPLTLREVWRDYCHSSDRLTLADLKELAGEVNSTIYWDDVFREMARVSENEFVDRERIRFPVPDADAALETLCPGDYIPIQDISLWAHFPPLEVPWNGYVLESYLLRDSAKFRLEHVSAAAENGFYGVIVRKSSPFQSYEAVIMDMLAHSREWKDEKTALKWIVDRGCQARKRFTNFDKVVREARLLREKLENETG